MTKKDNEDGPINIDSIYNGIGSILSADDDSRNDFSLSEENVTSESQISIDAESEARARKSRVLKQNEEMEQERKKVYNEKNIVARAKLLSLLGTNAIKYIHYIKPRQQKDRPIEISVRPNPASELNLMAAFDALYDFGSGIVPFPHMDTFGQRLVDEYDEPLSNKNIRIRELMMALNICGMDNPRSINVLSALKTWAIDHESDFLQEHFEKTIPKWDGISRLESEMIKLFKCFNTDLNREFGRYFWLSLYNRIMKPGCLAPLSLALIGAQNSGKSYFCVQICKYLMGGDRYKPVQLDLSVNNYNNFLRDITGASIIANVGEKIGLKRSEMDRVKEFVAKGADDLNFKWEGSIQKQRQWIIVMDGNSYEGIQRDETGNRRFYPMFVGQESDKEGQPSWQQDYKADFKNFENSLWQIMAECRAWMKENDFSGYIKVVDAVSEHVLKFSAKEQKELRGTIRDSFIENNLQEILLGCKWKNITKGGKVQGWFTSTFEICQQFLNKKKKEPYYKGLKMYMEKLGFEQKQIAYRGYFLESDIDERDFKLFLLRNGISTDKFDMDELLQFEAECDVLIGSDQRFTKGSF